jgi:cardiolipin synthase (CMP-forming)
VSIFFKVEAVNSIANWITLVRIVLIPLFTILLMNGAFDQALWVFLAAAASDALDGFVARMFSQKTKLGSYLDPIADKLLLSTAFITLAVLKQIPGWLTVVVISRDVIIVVGVAVLFLNQMRLDIKPSIISKMTTAFQVLVILVALSAVYIRWPVPVKTGVVYVTLALTVASGLHYIYRGLRHLA